MKKSNLKIEYSVATNAGIRPINEDAAWIGFNQSKQILAIICDGIGSQANSEMASQFVVDYFSESFTKTNKIHFINRWFRNTLRGAYTRLHQAHKNIDIGTTLVAAIISEDTAHIFNIGDSRAYYYDNSFHNWNKITTDHNLYNFLRQHHAPESVYIKNKGSLLSLTSYISSQTDKHMDYNTYSQQLMVDDLLLLVSDGVYNYINLDRVNYQLSHERVNGFDKICDGLLNIAIKSGSNDNVSAILIEVSRNQ